MQSEDTAQTTQEIIRKVLPLRNQRRIDPAAFLSLTDRLGITETEPKIYFLRELSAIIRTLPLKAFESPDDRLRLVEGVQQALDEAVDEEEEELS